MQAMICVVWAKLLCDCVTCDVVLEFPHRSHNILDASSGSKTYDLNDASYLRTK